MITPFYKNIKQWLPAITRNIFLWLLTAYFVLLLIEKIDKLWLRWFQFYILDIDMNIFLITVIAIGIIYVLINFFSNQQTKESPPPTQVSRKYLFTIIFAAIGSGFLVYYGLKQFGLPGILASVSIVPIIFLILYAYKYA